MCSLFCISIGFHTVLADIQAFGFLIRADPHTHDGLQGAKHDEREDERRRPHSNHADQLTHNRESRVGRVKQRAGQDAPDATHAVHRNGADRIVDLQLVQRHDREEHDHAGDQTNHDRPHGGNDVRVGRDARFACLERGQNLVRVIPDGRDNPQTGDDDTVHVTLLCLRWVYVGRGGEGRQGGRGVLISDDINTIFKKFCSSTI